MVIDAHMHLGEDLIFNTNDDEAAILAYMDAHGIDGALLQPGMLTHDVRATHRRIADFAAAHPGRFWGIAAFSPNLPEAEYAALARWAVEELGFVGLKLHPAAFCCAPTAPQAQKVYAAAEALGVPVMIHTGSGAPNALPALCIPVARQHPSLRLVMAHAGGGLFGAEALVAAEECPNITLETSWVPVQQLKKMAGRLGCGRLMLGTDLPLNAGVELAKYAALGLPEAERAQCLGGTARAVFGL